MAARQDDCNQVSQSSKRSNNLFRIGSSFKECNKPFHLRMLTSSIAISLPESSNVNCGKSCLHYFSACQNKPKVKANYSENLASLAHYEMNTVFNRNQIYHHHHYGTNVNFNLISCSTNPMQLSRCTITVPEQLTSHCCDVHASH